MLPRSGQARRYLSHRAERVTYSRHMATSCDVCGNEIVSARSDARYCSGRCRMIAYRTRQNADKPAPRRRPLPDQVWSRAYDLERAVRSLEVLAADDRFAKYARTEDGGHRLDVLERAADSLTQIVARHRA